MPPEPCPALGLESGAQGHMLNDRPARKPCVLPGAEVWLLPKLVLQALCAELIPWPGLGATGQSEEPMGRVGAGAPAWGQVSSAL